MPYYNYLPIPLLQWMLPSTEWTGNDPSCLYLTFDDGPHPIVTPKVLQLLKRFDAKATFFIVGQQAERYPDLVEQIVSQGHLIGSHSYSHRDAWRTNKRRVKEEMFKGQMLGDLKLFRPPYGHYTRSAVKLSEEKGARFIMWSKLTGDFDKDLSPSKVATEGGGSWNGGDVVVFHDSPKASRNMLLALRYVLTQARDRGVKLESL